jgi:hypothetical protein
MEGRTMNVRADNGVVTVKYQDDVDPDEESVVMVTPEGAGEGFRVEMRRSGKDTTLHLTAYDALALAAALTAAEVPAPPKGS